MWKRPRTWLLLLAIIGLTIAGLYESATHVGRGWLGGEAFFEGRPSSYWRLELKRWHVKTEFVCLDRSMARRNVYDRMPTQTEDFCRRWLPFSAASDEEPIHALLEGPRLIRRNEEAIPVLGELLDDPSPKVRLFAQIGLGMNPAIPEDD